MVRLLRRQERPIVRFVLGFNPTMVRLLRLKYLG